MMLDEAIERVESAVVDASLVSDLQTLLRAASLLKEVFEQVKDFEEIDRRWWADWQADAELFIEGE